MRTKYIVGRFKSNGCLGALVFPEFVKHLDMKDNFDEILGAGFAAVKIVYDTIEVEVYGNSHSLDVESRPEDNEIVKKCLGQTYD